MLIDSHGFPMRDDLKEHVQITRICYDGIFYMQGSQLKKKGKEVVDQCGQKISFTQSSTKAKNWIA